MDWNWYVLLIVPAAWFIQNCIHEGSHLLIGWIDEGLIPVYFRPYPHFENGRFYFASYGASGTPKTGKHVLRHIAPLFAGLIWAFIFAIIFVFYRSIFLLPMIVTGCVDALWWVRGYLFSTNPYNDGQRWKNG